MTEQTEEHQQLFVQFASSTISAKLDDLVSLRVVVTAESGPIAKKISICNERRPKAAVHARNSRNPYVAEDVNNDSSFRVIVRRKMELLVKQKQYGTNEIQKMMEFGQKKRIDFSLFRYDYHF